MSQGGGEALPNSQYGTLNKDLEPCTSSGQMSLNSKQANTVTAKLQSPRNPKPVKQKRPVNTVCVPQRSLMELIPD